MAGMGSKETLEERRGLTGDAGDFVGGLTVELAVDLRLRATLRKIAERSQYSAAEGPGGRARALHRQLTRLPSPRTASVTTPRA